ncbi:MAG: Ig-like domain-containing domain [Ferruginibacter sp.]
MKPIGYLTAFLLLFITWIISITGAGCAQIGAPTGGLKDTLAPVLVSANPKINSTQFKGNKITLVFNEYIDVKEIQTNLLVSPLSKTLPVVDFKLKTVTIKLKDTLLPNTTYALNFGNAIADNNEGNPFKDFTYVFSTGPTIDSLTLSGTVLLAESNRVDSTITAMLYKTYDDSTVLNKKPDYLAKLDGNGKFKFTNLASGAYKLYALKDGDGGKTYNSTIETFAFADSDIVVSKNVANIDLFASALEKETKNKTPIKSAPEKKLRYNSEALIGVQDLLSPLQISFNNAIKIVDSNLIQLTDSNYKKITSATLQLDSTKKFLSINPKWVQDELYILIIDKKAIADTTGNTLTKSDTIRFKTKRDSDYGNLVLRFKGYVKDQPLVIQFFKGDDLYTSATIKSALWSNKLFTPGEYELRLLYDTNKNGQWDPGNYHKKLQPEKVKILDKKLSIRSNWDTERDIQL